MSNVSIQENVSLKALNTFGFEAKAKKLAVVETYEQFCALPFEQYDEVVILGGGSNICLTHDLGGLVLHNQVKGFEVVDETEQEVRVEVGGGVIWQDLVKWALDRNLGGIENLSLIPGTVGAAPIQNIGAYGVELKEVFVRLEAWSLENRRKVYFEHAQCRFGYRNSIFKEEAKGKYLIAKVQLRLTKAPHTLQMSYGAIGQKLQEMKVTTPDIQSVSAAVIAIRKSKLPDPALLGNAGSFFKNPELPMAEVERIRRLFPDVPVFAVNDQVAKIPAAWLIEQCGWKGKRLGNVGCHKDQALVLVHYGGGSGEEIFQLSQLIQKDVFEKFGVQLHAEVNFL
jgi:UDP-N-acetylmuramate dehydrogenase